VVKKGWAQVRGPAASFDDVRRVARFHEPVAEQMRTWMPQGDRAGAAVRLRLKLDGWRGGVERRGRAERQVLAVCGLSVASVHLLELRHTPLFLPHRPHFHLSIFVPYFISLLNHIALSLPPSASTLSRIGRRPGTKAVPLAHARWVHHTTPVSTAVQTTNDYIQHVVAGPSTASRASS